MKEIKKGDIVSRKSYQSDIIFSVEKIVKTNNSKTAILKGIFERIQADSDIEDLEILDKKVLKEKTKKFKTRINEVVGLDFKNYENINKNSYQINNTKRIAEKIITGKILHLDGDKKYSEKSYKYYKKSGQNAIVKNIAEYRQPKIVYQLLKYYEPDILVITGHDGMIKRGVGYHDLYNYRNSRYFIETVKEARRYDKEFNKKTAIFAGACQSYFEAIISAGANFASSPARILIDFLDPLIVAQSIACAEKYKYIRIDDIEMQLRDGKKGINGIGASGKMKKLYI